MNFTVVSATMDALKAKLVKLEERAVAIFTEDEQKSVAELHAGYREVMDDIHAHLGTLQDFAASIEGRVRKVEDKVGLGDLIAKTGDAATATAAAAPAASAEKAPPASEVAAPVVETAAPAPAVAAAVDTAAPAGSTAAAPAVDQAAPSAEATKAS